MRKNSNSNNAGCEMKFQDKKCHDAEEICKEWGNYFCFLYSNADDGDYDYDHLTPVTSQVAALKQRELDPNSVTPIRNQVLSTAISELNKGKASGSDCTDNGHLINSGQLFRNILLVLFNSMLLKSHIPQDMKTETVKTLYKGGNKCKDDPNSYRAITLTSAKFTKTF